MSLIIFFIIVVLACTLYYVLWMIVRRKSLTCRLLSLFALSALFFGDQFFAVFYEWRYNSVNCELKVYERPNNVRGYIAGDGSRVGKDNLALSDYDWIEGPAYGNGNSMMVSRRLTKESNGQISEIWDVKPISRYLVDEDELQVKLLTNYINIRRLYVMDLKNNSIIAEYSDARARDDFLLAYFPVFYAYFHSDICRIKKQHGHPFTYEIEDYVFNLSERRNQKHE